ncbi:MAG: hypothetical protein Satyrvirus1_20 [Satyrvirus sp.]|uniref:Uncharacterized protein n=1 Tax=Satyrvirus sp. TaxID=2487771 RepID=A0A3G5AEB0_9VIRU|nr:MAG: hypothetical protein Satyrvirus1_20 [Satyrvirus sp.]
MNRPKLKNIFIEYSNKNSSLHPGSCSEDNIVIFLAGPTPSYPLAQISWRDSLANYLDNAINKQKIGHKKIILICPEPYERNWSFGPDDQICWEHLWLERSNVILFWHETRWKPNRQTLINCYHGSDMANIGIQFRFEVGMYIADLRKIRIFYVPPHAEGVAGVEWWIKNKPDNLLSIVRTEFDTANDVLSAIYRLS